MTTLKDMMAEANAVIERVDVARAQELAANGALLLDIRDGTELQQTGQAAGSMHVPRGSLEFAAAPDSPAKKPEFQTDRPIVLFCAAGGRAALAGKMLKDLGYEQVYNMGGFKDWVEAGGAIE